MGAPRVARELQRPETNLVLVAARRPRLRRASARVGKTRIRCMALERLLGAARIRHRVQARRLSARAERARQPEDECQLSDQLRHRRSFPLLCDQRHAGHQARRALACGRQSSLLQLGRLYAGQRRGFCTLLLGSLQEFPRAHARVHRSRRATGWKCSARCPPSRIASACRYSQRRIRLREFLPDARHSALDRTAHE